MRVKDPFLAQTTPTNREQHAIIVNDNWLDNDNIFSFTTIGDEEVMGCFLNFPIVNAEHQFALNYSSIAVAQKNDPLLSSKLRTNHAQHGEADIGNKQTMIVFCKHLDDQAHICLPDSLLESTVSFYHQVLEHTGSSRVIKTMAQHFYDSKIVTVARELIGLCETCQLYKA